MSGYDIRRARRARENERSLCGETLETYHARENPARTAPGAGIPRVRCDRTPSLLAARHDGAETEPYQPQPVQARLL